MNCYLHIGTEKTATKTLQTFLHVNRRKFRDYGYLFTKSAGEYNNRGLPAAAYDLERRDDFTKHNQLHSAEELGRYQARLVQSLKNELLKAELPTVIFSSEHIQSRLTRKSEIQRLKTILQELGIANIQVIVYLRKPAEIANSLYSTAVQNGSVRKQPPPPDQEYFENICNHRKTLQLFGEIFGKKNLIPRIFHSSEFKNGSFLEDFLEAIQAPALDHFQTPPNQNTSLSALGIEILRRFNQSVPCFVDEQPNPFRQNITAYFQKYFSDHKYVMAEELFAAYEDHFRDSNSWVRKEFFPEKDQLFPETVIRENNSVGLTEEDLDRLANLLTSIWVDKHQQLFDCILESQRSQ